MIRLVSVQTTDGEEDRVEVISEGRYCKKADGFEISYDETEATGFAGSRTTIALQGGLLTMTRKGSALSQLTLEKGSRHLCRYGTPFGSFDLGVTAERIVYKADPSSVKLDFKYMLDINSSYSGTYEIKVFAQKNSGKALSDTAKDF